MMVFCRYCGKELHESAPTCPHCEGVQNKNDIAIPDGIKGWSWGAFLLNWIWAIGNRTWVGLLALVPLAGVIMAFILGLKGREWAWRNKHWENVEHFNQVQKKWSVWGVSIFACIVVINGVLGISAYQDYVERAKQAEPSWQSNEPSSQSLPQLEQPAESLQVPTIEAERWMDDGVPQSTEPLQEMPLDNNDVDAIAKMEPLNEKGKPDAAMVSASAPLSYAAFSKSFRCPEDLPHDLARQDALDAFLTWAQESLPSLTIQAVAELRIKLLEEHQCEETLASIRSSSTSR